MKHYLFTAGILIALLLAGCASTEALDTEATHNPSTAMNTSITIESVPIESSAAPLDVTTAPETEPQEETVPVTSVPETEPEPTQIPVTEPTKQPELLNVPVGHRMGCYESGEHQYYMYYYLFVPENATTDMPLVIYLHGDGDVGKLGNLLGNGMSKLAKQVYGNKFPFLLLTPNTKETSWIDSPIPETLMDLIESVAEEYKVDREKIIITGHSRGAIGVWYLVNEYGDYFSAAVPVSCDSDIAEQHNYDMFAKVPIRAFVGDGDQNEIDITEPMKSYIEMAKLAGGDAELVILPDANHMQALDQAFTEETFMWMLEQ